MGEEVIKMCKNHNQLHYHPMLREVAAILAGPGDDGQLRDALLMRATAEGLDSAATQLDRLLTPLERVRVMSRLEAVKAASTDLAARFHEQRADLAAAKAVDEVPF